MSKYNLVSVDSIISKLFREELIGPNYNESDIIEMIGEALSAIGAYKQLTSDIQFLEIADHKALLPEGLEEIVMVAYSLDNSVDSSNCTTECNIDDDCDTGCDDEDVNECWSCNNKYYIPDQRYYDLIKDYTFINSQLNNYFYQNFLPLRLASSPFSVTKMLHCHDCINVIYPSEHEYSIQDGTIRTSFQEGKVCLAYLKVPTDDNGYPMVPDLFEYYEAITAYVLMKMSKSRYFSDPTAANRNLYREMQEDWHWYVRGAKNRMLLPQNIDERENLFRGNMKLLKQNRGYYNFFGNMNDLERFNLHGGSNRKRYRY